MQSTNALRGIFALMIVWHHLVDYLGISYNFEFGNTIVLFFFILSGFGITLSWKDKMQGNSYIFLKKRLKSIFPIHIITFLLFIVLGIDILWISAIPFHLTLTQSWVPWWQINFTINTPSWFLSSLLFCYLLTPFLLKTLNKNVKLFISLFLTYLIGYNLLLYLLPSSVGTRWLGYVSPSLRIIDYSFGILLALIWKSICPYIDKINYKIYSFVEIILLVCIVAVMYKSGFEEFNVYTFLRYPLIGLSIIVFSISKGFVSLKILSAKIFQWLGNMSFTVYMTHALVLWLIFNRLPWELNMNIYIKIFIAYFAIIATAIVFKNYILPNFNSWMSNAFYRMSSLYNRIIYART